MSPSTNSAPAPRFETAIIVLSRREVAATLRLESDPDGRRPCLARAMGYALSHAERTLPVEIRSLVLAVARALARRAGDGRLHPGEGGSRRVIDRLRTVARRLDSEARIELVRVLRGEIALPCWPLALRIGAPPPTGAEIWPFDPEVAALGLGLRTVVKREPQSQAEAIANAIWWRQRGFIVREMPRPNGADVRPTVQFCGRESGPVDEAVEAESSLAGRDDDKAIRRLGRALGYPACCVDAFLRRGRRDDLSLASERIPTIGASSADPLSQWLIPPLALVSHVPCSLHCPDTLRYAAAVLQALDRQVPSFAERWRHLARRLHAVDHLGRCLSFVAEGELDRGATVVAATEYRRDGRGMIELRSADELVGERLCGRRGEVIGESSGFRVSLVADHRGCGDGAGKFPDGEVE